MIRNFIKLIILSLSLIFLLVLLISGPYIEWLLDPYIREAMGLGDPPYEKVEDYYVKDIIGALDATVVLMIWRFIKKRNRVLK
ncbi:hypothetical protein H2C83_13440 [Thermoactinomyces sp. AMNI-1]|uniref:Uncharacterized protein n=2 Tax=Thermoactinomyces mirandus TaxID=2756294 RepID=A0A7W2ARS8_9BACL|nr:hypothetical protein [Thermoactinomyces mirandus]